LGEKKNHAQELETGPRRTSQSEISCRRRRIGKKSRYEKGTCSKKKKKPTKRWGVGEETEEVWGKEMGTCDEKEKEGSTSPHEEPGGLGEKNLKGVVGRGKRKKKTHKRSVAGGKSKMAPGVVL